MAKCPFKVGDRVARAFNESEFSSGGKGIVKEIHEETIQQGDSREKDRPVIVGVQWDNGTISFFGPAGLKAA